MIGYSFIFFIFQILFLDIAQLFKKEDLFSLWKVAALVMISLYIRLVVVTKEVKII